MNRRNVALTLAILQPIGSEIRGDEPLESLANYAPASCSVGCLAEPAPLAGNAWLAMLPGSHLAERLRQCGVERVAVFHRADEFAAAARFKEQVDLRRAVRNWHRTDLVVTGEPPVPQPVEVGGRHCVTVPAGTFLPVARPMARLAMTNRSGQPVEHGINVGEIVSTREYIEGATKATATFTLDDVSEDDFRDGQLPLRLTMRVFRTYRLPREFSVGEFRPVNPDTGLAGEWIRFEAVSHRARTLNVPRQLAAADGDRELDIVRDLIVDGELQVEFRCTDRAIYFGFSPDDLSVENGTPEYIFVSGRDLVVAQSQETLEAMLSDRANLLRSRLASSAGDMRLVAELRDAKVRLALRRRLSSFGVDRQLAAAIGTGRTLMVDLDGDGPHLAEVMLDMGAPTPAKRLSERLREESVATRDRLRKMAVEGVNRERTKDNLREIWAGLVGHRPLGFSTRACFPNVLSASGIGVLVGEVLSGLQVETLGRTVAIRLSQPPPIAELSEPRRIEYGLLVASRAAHCAAAGDFTAAVAHYRRVTDVLPNLPRAWFTRANKIWDLHVEFDGYESQYSWLHRAVDVLLDGIERHPGASEYGRLVGELIGSRLGRANDSRVHRNLFARDADLHDRLRRLIPLQSARDPEGHVDNWLVAKLLFHRAATESLGRRAVATLDELTMFASVPKAQADNARSLARSGNGAAAAEAWREAARLYRELGNRRFNVPPRPGHPALVDVQLSDASDHESKLTAEQKQRLDTVRDLLDYDTQMKRCEVEIRPEVLAMHEHARKAEQRFDAGEIEQAVRSCERSLTSVEEMVGKDAEAFEVLAGDLSIVARVYTRSRELLDAPAMESLQPLLARIEKWQESRDDRFNWQVDEHLQDFGLHRTESDAGVDEPTGEE